MIRHSCGKTPRVVAMAVALVASVAACGSDDDGGGAAGSAPMVAPGLGTPCANTNECLSGTTCGFAGLFTGQCSAQCNGSVASCSMLALDKTTYCFGNAECGLRCTNDGECPLGTHCVNVAGTTGCLRTP